VGGLSDVVTRVLTKERQAKQNQRHIEKTV